MTATETYEITLPKRVVTPLARQAKSSKSTLSEIILRIIQEHNEMMEDLRVSAILAEREAGGEKLVPMSKIWNP